ncbi:hypothetical protein, partial [Pseudomonas tehranensis]|uniref:hypothetical protein n=1 Tax=Pseudomonas tehranensis TaxID=2745502 RepID=UPI001CD8659B
FASKPAPTGGLRSFLQHETFFMKPTPATKRRTALGLQNHCVFHEIFLTDPGIYLAGYPNL